VVRQLVATGVALPAVIRAVLVNDEVLVCVKDVSALTSFMRVPPRRFQGALLLPRSVSPAGSISYRFSGGTAGGRLAAMKVGLVGDFIGTWDNATGASR
jgi:hypothetical protein